MNANNEGWTDVPKPKPYLELGQILKTRRKELKFTQMQTSSATGIELRHYQRIESGVIDIRYNSLLKICKYLKLDMNFTRRDETPLPGFHEGCSYLAIGFCNKCGRFV